ncbi:uncharacterized protein PHALS_04564 [Plasmopara halstedii]|uniref:Uncharacterized protein n=1 Tax=Plasmopara halstedii TaxID=4781 RepID=A0A0P1A8V6_PLAHL|nr:uncharacterized protein PHALS_04564 [Plasmopara halstedii]CEG37109.1 hypothetical protein PHALS_04564 [Plasmopara halstedii]|eukprot:XP_024573478.1 hypothetical protein PHALS_04564 [Plasmopara halstedii]
MQDPNQCSQIRLTREECVKYDNAARKLLQDTVAERAKFNPTNIDSEHWAFVKRRKEVSIFNNVIGSAHPGLIVMIGTGLIDGKLEDVMGGLYSETTDEFQTSKILLGYDLKDGLVLNAHQRRTSEDPFRFAGIKWFAGRRAWGLLHDQNALTYERMGLTTDARGNEIAYHTLQSITRPEWPCEPTPNMLRQHTAVCYLYRRLMQTNKTEVFVWGSITKSRLVLERFFHFNVASTWLKIVDSPNVGRAKNFSTLIDKADSHQWLATSLRLILASSSCAVQHATSARESQRWDRTPIVQDAIRQYARIVLNSTIYFNLANPDEPRSNFFVHFGAEEFRPAVFHSDNGAWVEEGRELGPIENRKSRSCLFCLIRIGGRNHQISVLPLEI